MDMPGGAPIFCSCPNCDFFSLSVPDVVGISCCCLALLGIVPRIPGRDEELAMRQSSQQGGGEAATAMVAEPRLGADAAFVGKVGDDPVGEMIGWDLVAWGGGIKHLQFDAGAQSLFGVVLVDEGSGKRTIVSSAPTFAALTPAEFPEGLVESAAVLHLDGNHRDGAAVADLSWPDA